MVKRFGAKTLVVSLTPKHFEAASADVMVNQSASQRRAWDGYASELGKMRHVFTWAKKTQLIQHAPDCGQLFRIGKNSFNKEANRLSRSEGV